MKKKFIIASVTLFLIASPAYASQSQKNSEHTNQENNGQIVASEHRENDRNNNELPVQHNADQATTTTTSPTPNVTITLSPSPATTSEDRDESHDDKPNVLNMHTSTEGCGAENTWKNHGEYVSCVAREHLGGKSVSDAAKSDVGKKEEEDNHDGDEDDLSITPSISPSVSPSVSPTITPPLTSPAQNIHFGLISWEELKRVFSQLFRGLHFGKNR